MALSRALFLFALIATIFSTMAVAKDFVVGDESGWTLGVDYQAWAANKVFRLGDTLTFKYVAWKDSVVRVNGSDFQSCSVPWAAPVLTSGHDKIALTTFGRRWYISGVANHCENGQKLFINVLPKQDGWYPAPSSPSASPSPSPVPAPEAAPPSNAPWAASVQTSELTWSPVPSPSPTPAPEAAPPSNAPWVASVQASEINWSPVPSPTPAPQAAPPSNAPWTAPRRSLLQKKLFKTIHRNLITV